MKLFSNILNANDVTSAVDIARDKYRQDIYVDDIFTGNSRKRALRVEFHLGSVNGRYARNSGTHGGNGYNRAATWSAWGYVIAELYRRDPEALIGQYGDRQSFFQQCQDVHSRMAQYNPSQLNKYDISFLEVL